MSSFRKNKTLFSLLSFKALLLPQRWLCILSRFILAVVGIIVLLLAGWYPGAVVLIVFSFFLFMFDMITPDQIFLIQSGDKMLLIEIFKNDFKRRKKDDMQRRISFIRIIEESDDGSITVLWPGQMIFGFDDSLYRSGILLIKSRPREWLVICEDKENSYLLQHYADKTAPDGMAGYP